MWGQLSKSAYTAGADPGGVDWVSSHPPMGFNRRQKQLMKHKD